jgi:beta-glucosidase
MRLGMFDPPEMVPYASIPYEVNDSDEHRELALEAARASIVLLKNDKLLPLKKKLGHIAVIGPNAYDHHVLVANYFGEPSKAVTPLDGIRAAVGGKTKIGYAQGCKRQGDKTDGLGRAGNLSEAVSVAERADVVVLCLGLDADIEGEQGDAGNSDAGGDKKDLKLTGLQNRLLEEIVALGKPVVLVVIAGSPLDLAWAHDHAGVGAILQAWYPGEEGGTAIADVLFGNVSPAGRLPVTFPRRIEDVPEFTNYAMKGRTYRYLEAAPLYPFGYGLSYTRFVYKDLEVSKPTFGPGETTQVTVTVQNAGKRESDEVVQLYVKDLEASVVVPHHALKAFQRLHLRAGESKRVSFDIGGRELALVDESGRRVLEPGRFRIYVGGSQPDARSAELGLPAPLSVEIDVIAAAAAA